MIAIDETKGTIRLRLDGTDQGPQVGFRACGHACYQTLYNVSATLCCIERSPKNDPTQCYICRQKRTAS